MTSPASTCAVCPRLLRKSLPLLPRHCAPPSPIKRLPDGTVFLTRYDEVEFVYKNPKIFSSDKKREFGDKFGAERRCSEHHTHRVWYSMIRLSIHECVGSSTAP